tara:strand:+ start:1601 stop:2242 length:642 start_codon:yes stop_codon:yes gene_type:complete
VDDCFCGEGVNGRNQGRCKSCACAAQEMGDKKSRETSHGRVQPQVGKVICGRRRPEEIPIKCEGQGFERSVVVSASVGIETRPIWAREYGDNRKALGLWIFDDNRVVVIDMAVPQRASESEGDAQQIAPRTVSRGEGLFGSRSWGDMAEPLLRWNNAICLPTIALFVDPFRPTTPDRQPFRFNHFFNLLKMLFIKGLNRYSFFGLDSQWLSPL